MSINIVLVVYTILLKGLKLRKNLHSLIQCIWVLPTKLNSETGKTSTLEDLETETGKSRILIVLVVQFFKL